MKICQICSHYNVGGAGKIIHYLHKQTITSGNESIVIFGRKQFGSDENVYRIGNDFTNYIDALITRLIGLAGFQSWLATKQLIRILKKEKPNVLHLHGLHGYYLNYSILFNYINNQNIPCVWTFHDCLAFTGKCGHPHDCTKYIDGCNKCPRLKDYPTTYGFDFTKYMWKKKKELFTFNKHIIVATPSNWMHDMVDKSYFKNNRIITVNNGIDTDNTFKYSDKKTSREFCGFSDYGDGLVLSVAFDQSNPNKGLKYVFEAARSLNNTVFVIVGWKESINNGFDLSEFPNIITFPFISDQLKLARIYSSADVFLLPSAAENYPTTALESIACGCPVIAFNVGGNSEIISTDKGRLVEKGNQQCFNKAIYDLCHDDMYNDQQRKHISDDICKNNSMSSMFKKYNDIYTLLYMEES